MAADWIMMRVDLFDDPSLLSIAYELDLDPEIVLAKLYRLWVWADRHLSAPRPDSVLPLSAVDRVVSASGFGRAMVNAKWLVEVDGTFEFPNWDRWMGKTAKIRSKDVLRKRMRRSASLDVQPQSASSPQDVREMSAPAGTEIGNVRAQRIENREEKPPPPTSSKDRGASNPPPQAGGGGRRLRVEVEELRDPARLADRVVAEGHVEHEDAPELVRLAEYCLATGDSPGGLFVRRVEARDWVSPSWRPPKPEHTAPRGDYEPGVFRESLKASLVAQAERDLGIATPTTPEEENAVRAKPGASSATSNGAAW